MGSNHGFKSWVQIMGSNHKFKSWVQIMGSNHGFKKKAEREHGDLSECDVRRRHATCGRASESEAKHSTGSRSVRRFEACVGSSNMKRCDVQKHHIAEYK